MSLYPKRCVTSIVSTVPQDGADQKEEDDVDSKGVQQPIATETDQRAKTGNGTESESQYLLIYSCAEPPRFDPNSTDSLSVRDIDCSSLCVQFMGFAEH